jgi:DNA-binding PucR family transcriptional regulator
MTSDDLTRELTRRLTQDPHVASELLDRILQAVPDVAPDEEVRAGAIAMIKASLDAYTTALEDDTPDEEIEVPARALKYARQLAWVGVTVDQILRGYRLGQEFVFEVLSAIAEERGVSDPDVVRFAHRAGALSFRMLDALCTRVTAEFASERETIMRGALARRASVIRTLLAGDRVSLDEAERTLGYRLDQRHLGALVWRATDRPDGRGPSVDQVADALAEPLGAGRPLVLHDGPDLIGCWFGGIRHEPQRAALEAALPDGFRLATGRTGSGVEGFRTTRTQAERARAVMLAGAAPSSTAPSVIRYDDIALVHLLIADREAAREYALDQLGPLAADDETSATLRNTLLAVLSLGGQQEASEALFIHRNTVAQRLRKAEELLGHTIRERRTETETALLISQWLGSRPPQD